jgi:hypothetical protein
MTATKISIETKMTAITDIVDSLVTQYDMHSNFTTLKDLLFVKFK